MKKIYISIFAVFVIMCIWNERVSLAEGDGNEPSVEVQLINYLGDTDEVLVKTVGEYVIKDQSVILVENTTYSIERDGNQMTLYDISSSTTKKELITADTITLLPINYEADHIKLSNPENSNGYREYMGSMSFSIEEEQFVRPLNKLFMEDYLKGVVPYEMPALWEKEAVKAQTIAARGYAIQKNKGVINDTIQYQVYGGMTAPAGHPNSNAAVDETTGQALTYNDKVIDAVYSASNGGITESNQNAWGTDPLPYFKIKEDSFDGWSDGTPIEWLVQLQKQQIITENLDLKEWESWWDEKKEVDVNVTKSIKKWITNYTEYEGELKIINIPEVAFSDEGSGGRVTKGAITVEFFIKGDEDEEGALKLHRIEYKEVAAGRIKVMLGSDITSFLVDEQIETEDDFTIKGFGNGHGVGMSQYGARSRAKAGHSYEEILSFYYEGADLSTLYSLTDRTTANTLLNGWYSGGGHKYYYENGIMNTGWLEKDSHWYFLNEQGQLQTGWITWKNNKYYLNETGIMETGWVKWDGKWYYLSSSGVMATSWVKWNNDWYYLANSGIMQTGWLKWNNHWYYLENGGEMDTGWLKWNNEWYYLDAGGEMESGWIKSGGEWYYLASDGVMETGWIYTGGKWYYLYKDGSMAHSTTIDGYKLGSDGAWIQ
jgi:SpoIID/LytB domain protein